MVHWNACTKSSDRCYAQLKLIWLIQLPPMTLMSFLTMHGQFTLPITRYLKHHQGQPFLDKTCSSTFCSWLTGTKLENVDPQSYGIEPIQGGGPNGNSDFGFLPTQFDVDKQALFSMTDIGSSRHDNIVADLESFSIRHPVYNVECNEYN